MKKIEELTKINLPTLDFLNKRGTTKIVNKEFHKLKKLIKDIDEVYLDNEKMPIYFMYYVLFKYPSLISKLENYSDSFSKEISMCAKQIYPSFIEIYIECFLNQKRSFKDKYYESVKRLFEENKNTKKIKKVLNGFLSKPIKVYFMNGNIVKFNNLDFDVDENMIENYIYNQIVEELNSVNISDRYAYILKIKTMSQDAVLNFVSERIANMKKLNISKDIFNELVEDEKAIFRYITLIADEQYLTLENNKKHKLIRK